MILAYYKTSFFSRKQQEKLVEKIELEFNKTMFSILKEEYSQSKKKEDFQKLSSWINFSVSNYFFEKDLSDYLLSLNEFIQRYDHPKN